jgi:helicase
MKELALLLNAKRLVTPINNLRVRVKHGVKKELLPLIKYKGIGRVRARTLFVSGMKTTKELRKANLEILKRLLGEKTALKLKEQVEKQTSAPNNLNNY